MESVFFFVFSFNFNYILEKKNVFQLTGPHVAVANLGGYPIISLLQLL